MASDLLKAAGFSDEDLATAIAVSYVEADGPEATKRFGKLCAYGDAVGDLSLMDDKWGPSLSLFQVRTLRHPEDYPAPDDLRVAAEVRFPDKNVAVAFAFFKKWGWTPWSAYKHETYKAYMTEGFDYEVVLGHPDAEKWNS